MTFKLPVKPIPRQPGVSDRFVAVALAARFVDEVLSGLPLVLMPTLRAVFGLSYAQIGLLSLALNYVAAVVEPIGGLLIDIWRRPWLMAFGAAAVGVSTMLLGLAPTFAVLLAAFALCGLGSGPLAHTGDVVLIEAYEGAADRTSARSAFLDTTGALLAPLLVSITFWLGLDWRWLLLALGLAGVAYAAIILRTRFPRPANHGLNGDAGLLGSLRGNIGRVLANRAALKWLLFLLALEVIEAPLGFATVWLHEEAGMSQALVGVYKVMEMAVSLASLALLDRWLARSGRRRILIFAAAGLLVLFPAWLLLPGIATRFLLGVPLSFLVTVFWPIGRGQMLASAPGHGGTVMAIYSLQALLPLGLLFGLLAEAIGLTAASLGLYVGGTALLLLLAGRLA